MCIHALAAMMPSSKIHVYTVRENVSRWSMIDVQMQCCSSDSRFSVLV